MFARGWLTLLSGLLVGGCDGDLVNLGLSAPVVTGGRAGAAGSQATGAVGSSSGGVDRPATRGATWIVQGPVFPLEAGVLDSNVTLNANLDELFFSREIKAAMQVDIYSAAPAGAGWGSPKRLAELSVQDHDEASPAVSASGDELWFGASLEGGQGKTDIWHSAFDGSTWSSPEPIAALSSFEDDIPRPPGMRGTVMPLSSKRGAPDPDSAKAPLYRIYFAVRDTATSNWNEPTQTHLENVNSATGEFETADGFLTEEGLELYFSSTRGGDPNNSDLFVARRAVTDEPFGEPEPLDVNSQEAERDPWLSPDGQQLYFVSSKSGQFAIYRADRAPD